MGFIAANEHLSSGSKTKSTNTGIDIQDWNEHKETGKNTKGLDGSWVRTEKER
jgi:hypothetical protein